MAYNVENGFRTTGTAKNAPYINGENVATKVTFTITAGTTNQVLIRVNFLDGRSNAYAQAIAHRVWLSANATGSAFLGSDPSGTVGVNTGQGLAISQPIAKKVLDSISKTDGTIQYTITDSAKQGLYFAVQNPYTGKTEISRQLVTGDYG
jgi:hypothetical protein